LFGVFIDNLLPPVECINLWGKIRCKKLHRRWGVKIKGKRFKTLSGKIYVNFEGIIYKTSNKRPRRGVI